MSMQMYTEYRLGGGTCHPEARVPCSVAPSQALTGANADAGERYRTGYTDSAVTSCYTPPPREALRRVQLRGLQGLLQAHGEEGPELHLQGQQGVSGGQEAEEPLPVLPVPEVPGHGHEERG